MSIKRILVPIPDSANPAEEISLALSAATLLDAHVEALFISEPPAQAPAGIAYASSARYGQFAADAAVRSRADERERAAQDMRDTFARACGIHHVPLLDEGQPIDTLPSARWRENEGAYTALAVARAAAFDLIVAGSAAVARSLKDIAEASLLQSGRPVLLAPLSQGYSLNASPIVAWDESPQCWRAISAAVPFLQPATSVEVVSVGQEDVRKSQSQAEAIDYLACHGVTATGRFLDPQSLSVGAALLAEASEQKSGLLVMGAYSHSPLRERLLGGVTRHMLENTAATPVLMAH